MTEAQGRVLDAVRDATGDGWPVTVREVMRELGLASTQPVHLHLLALEAEGLVETNPTRRRGWRLTDAGRTQADRRAILIRGG